VQSRIMYIEQKTGESKAWIGRVTFSRTGKTVYYRDMALVRAKRGGISGNHYGYNREAYKAWDKEPTTPFPPGFLGEFWVSGPHKDGADRLYDNPVVEIDEDVREEYWLTIRNKPEMVNEATC